MAHHPKVRGEGTYYVTLPLVGTVSVAVRAGSEEEAIEKALAADLTRDNIEEWNVVESVVRGNVCYAPCSDACVDFFEPDEP